MALLCDPEFIPDSECPFCASCSKGAPNRNAYIKHAREKHPEEFAQCQFYRLRNDEFYIPEDIDIGDVDDYVLDLMTFIADKEADVPARCIFPHCDRTGRDRNIMAGHFRGAHRRTYTYCQEILNNVDAHIIEREVRKKVEDANLSDQCKTRRKYNYKPPDEYQPSLHRSSRPQRHQQHQVQMQDEFDEYECYDNTSDEAGSVYSADMDQQFSFPPQQVDGMYYGQQQYQYQQQQQQQQQYFQSFASRSGGSSSSATSNSCDFSF